MLERVENMQEDWHAIDTRNLIIVRGMFS
jgi:hypothetical protein